MEIWHRLLAGFGPGYPGYFVCPRSFILDVAYYVWRVGRGIVMTLQINAGKSGVTINAFIKDSSNDGVTGLVFDSAGLTCYYVRPGAVAIQLALVTQTITGTHADGGFVEVDAANMPGIYRLDLSNAIVASGVNAVKLMLQGAAGIVPTEIEIQLDLVDNVWDEILIGSTHNITNSSGRRMREADAPLIREETAQGSGTGNNQIQLDAGASAIDGAYDPAMVLIIDGTGTGQTRLILEYDGTTKAATVDRNWKINPDATSVFQILAFAGREHVNEGLAQAGDVSTITLNVLASSEDDVYVGQAIFIRSGTGEDQRKFVTAYNGITKIAAVHTPWDVIPDSTSGYVMLPQATGDYITAALPELTGASDIPATPTIPQALMLSYMRERNNTQVVKSPAERRILNDAGVEILDAEMSDDGTTFQQGKLTDA